MNDEMPLTDVCSLQSALNSVQANIFIADRDFKLVYMNPKAKVTLKKIENEVFEVFSIKIDNFIGGSIHRFHRDPNRVERILRNPQALPHEAIFEFGNVHLKTSISGIVGPEGKITGYIVNWEDVSEKAKLLKEMSNKTGLDVEMAQLLISLKSIEKVYGET